MALTGLVTLKLRSAATGILGAGMYVIVESTASALWMARATGDMRYLPQMALTTRLTGLITDAHDAAGLGTAGSGPTGSPGWVSLPPLLGAAVLGVWLVGLLGLWFVVLRRADIDE